MHVEVAHAARLGFDDHPLDGSKPFAVGGQEIEL